MALSPAELEEATRCVAVALNRATRATNRLYERALSDAGVSLAQFNVLVALTLGGAKTIGHLAEEIGVDRTTLSRNLSVMERDGLLTLSSDEADARTRTVEVSAAGLAALEAGYPAWLQAQRSLLENLGNDGEEVRAALAAVESAAERAR
ncbi:MAG: MarR family winged helix-turn-helix transcriptional regulator [Solirubrobacterales bacterium]